MGDELTKHPGRYWVLFYQPLPEAGERIAVGLVFDDGAGRPSLEYDSSFRKVSKVFPNVDRRALAFYLDGLLGDISKSSEIEPALNSYGPQIAASAARRLATPVSQEAIQMLMNRYLYPAKTGRRDRLHENRVSQEIETFVRGNIGSSHELRTGVTAKDVLGHSVSGTRRVALGVRTNSGWTLVDGVDLNQLTPQEAAKRADDVSRTFWKYGRATSDDSAIRVRRVGLVLNGSSHLEPKTHEVHDYALHRFQADSDLALDAASTEAGEQLRELLESGERH